jgi:hypothetical protein
MRTSKLFEQNKNLSFFFFHTHTHTYWRWRKNSCWAQKANKVVNIT